jgi:hypothetical protein
VVAVLSASQGGGGLPFPNFVQNCKHIFVLTSVLKNQCKHIIGTTSRRCSLVIINTPVSSGNRGDKDRGEYAGVCSVAEKGNDVHAVIMGCMLARVIGCMLCSIETNIKEISHRNQIDKIADVAVC